MKTNRISIFRRLLPLLCFVVLSFCTTLYAQLPEEILEIYPLPHQSIDTLTTTVSITFLDNTPQISDQNFFVYGNQTGAYPGIVTYEASTRIATFRPDIPYKIGEEITVLVTSAIIQGTPGGFMWTFNVSPYAGDGFPTGTLTLTGVNLPYALASGDFNNDGYLDLVSADVISHRLSLFFGEECENSSWPGFTPPVYRSTGLNPTDVLVLDVDGNGTLDLIASHYLSQILSIHLNDGAGNFSAPLTVDLGIVNPVAIETAEFTGDEFIDLVVAGLNSVVSMENDGSGGFTIVGPQLASGETPPGFSPSAPGIDGPVDILFPFSITTGDVDNDGYVDLFLGNFTETIVRKFTHRRNEPYFTEDPLDSIPLPYSPLQLKLVELECSTTPYPDLLVATEGLPEQYLRTFLNDGTGSFPTQHQAYQEDLPTDINFYVTNLDPLTDGTQLDLDVLANHLLNHRLLYYSNNCGTFTSSDFEPTGIGPRDVTGGDFNLDGAIDIAVPNSQNNTLILFISDLPPEKTLTVDPGLLDFGDISVCDTDTLSLWVINENLFPARISSISVINSDYFNLDPTSAFPVELNTGDSLRVSVIFQPGITGQIFDLLHLEIDNCNIIVEDIQLSGTGTNPLNVVPDPLDFGPVKLCGGHEESEIVVTNGSRNPVRILDAQIIYYDSIFTIESVEPLPPVDLDQGDTLRLVVRYTPVAPGQDVASISFDIENCSVDAQEMQLRGEGDAYTISASPDPIVLPDTEIDHLGGPVRVTVENLNNDASVPIRAYLKQGLPLFFMNASCTPTDTGTIIFAEIPPAGSIEMCLFFRPPDQITYTDTLIIEPEDTAACPVETISVSVSGTGTLNDPPEWAVYPQPDELRYLEGDQMEHTLYADDPDGDDLLPFHENVCGQPPLPDDISTDVCPPTDDLEGCLTFSWIAPQVPNHLDSIVYHPRFIVRETSTPELYADTLCLDVIVFQRLPDLQILSFTSIQGENIVNRTNRVRCLITSINQDVTEPFTFRMSTDEGDVHQWTVPGIVEGESVSYDTTFTFETLGEHWVEALVDVNSEVLEESENNNRDTLWLNVEQGNLIVSSNPFTPNGDGYNDHVEFDIAELNISNPVLYIFSIDGRRVVTISGARDNAMYWEGKDENGRALRPGAYLYVLKDGNRGIASGTLGLVR